MILKGKKTLLGGASAIVVATTFMSAAPAIAQDAVDEARDTIVVTGSRIARDGTTTPTPVTQIGREQLDFASERNIGDILNEVPAFGFAASNSANSNFGNIIGTPAGVNIVDLRGLGAARTLVLVNNRRHVGGLPGSTAVDLNSIPPEMIDRVEVITGGASAVYGSEAISGVVNVILKDEFEGLDLNIQGGITGRGDGESYALSAIYGSSILDDRGHLTISASYDSQDGIKSVDRERTETDFFMNPDGSLVRPGFSGFLPQGRFSVLPTADNELGRVTFDDVAGPLTDVSELSGPGSTDLVVFDSARHGFNRNFFRTLRVPVNRFNLSTAAKYNVTENIEAFAELSYSRSDTTSLLEHEFLGTKPVNAFGSSATPLRVPLTNPLVPDDLRALLDPAATEVSFLYRPLQWGQRTFVGDRNVVRGVIGLEGEFGDSFNWEVYFQQGTLQDTRTGFNMINNIRFQQALDAIDDPDNPGNLICRDVSARQAGCVPINIFGRNNVDPAAVEFTRATVNLNSELTQRVVAGYISGDAFELPAGALGFAAGFEYREEQSDFQPDSLSVAGTSSNGGQKPISGQFDVIEFFAETSIPVLADRPFFEALNIDAAVRYADYSTIGGVTNWKVGGEWSPIDAIRFRAVYSQASRAPNINELFTPTSFAFDGIIDPCSSEEIDANPNRAANCATLVAPGYTQAFSERQSVTVSTTGNLDLQEETAETLTLGAVFTPTDNLSLTVDYFDISVSDAINSLDGTLIVEQCVDSATLDNEFCSGVTSSVSRNSSGVLTSVTRQNINTATLETKGVDVEGTARFALGPVDYTFAALVNFLITDREQISLESPIVDNRAIIQRRGMPNVRANFRNTFDFGDFSVSALARYVGKTRLGATTTFNNPPAQVYVDLSAKYQFRENIQIYGGIDNLLDNDPPLVSPAFNTSTFGAGTAPELFEPFGRAFFLGARISLN